MSTLLLVASGLSALTVVLLAGISAVWVRNYRTFRSGLTLGLVAFAAVLLVENLVALYFFATMKMLYVADPSVHGVVLILRALQLTAVAILAYITWQ